MFLEVHALKNHIFEGPRAEKTHVWGVRVLKTFFPSYTDFLGFTDSTDSLDVLDSTDSIEVTRLYG